jgi:hypothetical protein
MTDESIAPIEIPWRFAATTQQLSAGEPDETAISLFSFLPKDEEINSHYPDQRLVYLKLTISVSPAAFPNPNPAPTLLGEGVPCFHLRLDMKVRLIDNTTGIAPYFHAAAPLRREMLQTGIIGAEAYEGEAEAQYVGKSGSQMHEAFRSHSTTNAADAGASLTIPTPIGALSVGGAVATTSTSVSADRGVTQFVDSTQRQASEERRELISHTNRVENLLTLLSAKYLGTQHLSFSMSPRPLILLSVDPSDPNLWFSQLLARRSSGIEGIQEFTILLLVPRGKDFCVEARLRRVCLLDDPPGPLTLDEQFDIEKPEHVARMINYLKRAYPIGTPLEELDVDLSGQLKPSPDAFFRPVIFLWGFTQQFVLARVVSPPKSIDPGTPSPDQVVYYKHAVEVWREVLIDEYEREVARSPIERGVLISEDRLLDTCLGFAGGKLVIRESHATVSEPSIVDLNPPDVDLGGVSVGAGSITSTARARAYEVVTRWNLLDSRLATLLANRRHQERRFRLDDPRVLDIILHRWAKLSSEDPRNLSLEAATKFLDLKEPLRQHLKRAGITDLRGLASILLHASVIEQYNQSIESSRAVFRTEEGKDSLANATTMPLTAEDREALLRQLGSALQATFESGKASEA